MRLVLKVAVAVQPPAVAVPQVVRLGVGLNLALPADRKVVHKVEQGVGRDPRIA
jgi:hypothetical protein